MATILSSTDSFGVRALNLAKTGEEERRLKEGNVNQREVEGFEEKIKNFKRNLYTPTVPTNPLPITPQNEPIQERRKNGVVKAQSEKPPHSMASLVRMSNRIVYKLSSVFPWDLFPNTLTIEECRITFIKRMFFGMSEVHSVDIKDISNIFINTSPFFAEIEVVSRTFTENSMTMNKFKKAEAIYARRIIEGLRTFLHEEIDTSKYEIKDLKRKLEQLSSTTIVL